VFSIQRIIIFKNTVANNRIADNPAPQPHAKARRRGVCVNASVGNHILSINNIELAFSQGVVVELGVFSVLMLDLYEWNSGQVYCKIHTYESKLRANMSCKNY
jgi:hypothetical protein